jgi:hypothetical protein
MINYVSCIVIIRVPSPTLCQSQNLMTVDSCGLRPGASGSQEAEQCRIRHARLCGVAKGWPWAYAS